jgi:hypothetical protein
MRNLLFSISLVFITPFIALTAHGASIELSKIPAPEAAPTASLLSDQIPQSRVATGEGVISKAYLASPTRRYDHGVLGDGVEAASLTVVLSDGKELRYDLPDSRVFEDLEPRLVDLDGEDPNELVVVETDSKLGASLAVYGLREGKLEKLAATPFIGRAYRWLNPVGAGDFNGDGVSDLALVSTPHIGGVLKLYSYTPPKLTSYAQKGGVSTHSIGSTNLGMGRVVKGEGKDLILAPSQSHNKLLLLEWVDGKIVERARVGLPSDIVSALESVGAHLWRFRLKNGDWYRARVKP